MLRPRVARAFDVDTGMHRTNGTPGSPIESGRLTFSIANVRFASSAPTNHSQTDVAPALFNAALVSRLNSIGVTGAPMEFSKLTMKTMVRYMESHEAIRRISDGLKVKVAGRSATARVKIADTGLIEVSIRLLVTRGVQCAGTSRVGH